MLPMFLRQQWSPNAPQCYVIRTLSVLLIVSYLHYQAASVPDYTAPSGDMKSARVRNTAKKASCSKFYVRQYPDVCLGDRWRERRRDWLRISGQRFEIVTPSIRSTANHLTERSGQEVAKIGNDGTLCVSRSTIRAAVRKSTSTWEWSSVNHRSHSLVSATSA